MADAWHDPAARSAALVALAILTTTVVLVAAPGLQFAISAPQLDVALTTVGAITALAVAALSFARFGVSAFHLPSGPHAPLSGAPSGETTAAGRRLSVWRWIFWVRSRLGICS